MKNLFFIFFLVIAHATYAANYFIYDRPATLSHKAANALMADLSLNADSFDADEVILPNGMLSSDFSYDMGQEPPPFSKAKFTGIKAINNAKQIQQTYLIDGPANIRLTPPQKMIYDILGAQARCFAVKEKKCGQLTDTIWAQKCGPFSNADIEICTNLAACVSQNIKAQCNNDTRNGDCPLQHKKCDGSVIGSFEDKTLVLATQSYGDWFFVTDGASSGWTAKANLKVIPENKIYLNQEIKNPEDFFKSKADEYTVRANLKELQLAQADYTFNATDKNLKNYCPQNITPFEADGFVSSSYPKDLPALKYDLSLLCQGIAEAPKYQEVQDVALKTDNCACYEGSAFEEYEAKTFKKEEAFYFEEKGVKKYQCQVRKHFIVCYRPNPCETEGCGFWPIEKICPKECMTWKNKTL